MREEDHPRERYPSIELSDKEHLEKLTPPMSAALKEKFDKARNLIKDIKVTEIRNEPPSIPMKLEMPILEKAIKKGNKDAKRKSKSPASKPKKNDSKPHKAAVARIQD